MSPVSQTEVANDSSAKSVPALQWLNFLVADIQTGLGPFLAAYLAASHWNPRDIGFALTLGGLVTVSAGPFAGALIDVSSSKRGLVAGAVGMLAAGAALLTTGTHWPQVAVAQTLIGAAGAVLLPALAAILGHSGLRMVMRYVHPQQEHKDAAMARYEEYLASKGMIDTAATKGSIQ